jgi:uncharacterized protein YwqG
MFKKMQRTKVYFSGMKFRRSLLKWLAGKNPEGKAVTAGYVLEHAPRSREDILKVMKAFHLEKYFPAIEPLLKQAIHLQVAKDQGTKMTGASTIGGRPHLPSGTEWPRNRSGYPLAFVAQVDLETCSAYDSGNLLPHTGTLLFFYNEDYEQWADEDGMSEFKVLHVPSEQLYEYDFPEELEATYRYTRLVMEPEQVLEMPDGRNRAFATSEIPFEIQEQFDELNRNEEIGLVKLLGICNPLQEEMEETCAFADHGLRYPGEDYEETAKSLRAEIAQWMLLFQIGVPEGSDMTWGDEGCLYFWIRKDDLLQANFNRVHAILQCH